MGFLIEASEMDRNSAISQARNGKVPGTWTRISHGANTPVEETGFAVFTGTDLTMVMDAIIKGLKFAKKELNHV